MTEKKVHDIDEKLDELETLVALYEAKMDSLPEEAFNHPPIIEEPQDGEDGYPA